MRIILVQLFYIAKSIGHVQVHVLGNSINANSAKAFFFEGHLSWNSWDWSRLRCRWPVRVWSCKFGLGWSYPRSHWFSPKSRKLSRICWVQRHSLRVWRGYKCVLGCISWTLSQIRQIRVVLLYVFKISFKPPFSWSRNYETIHPLDGYRLRIPTCFQFQWFPFAIFHQSLLPHMSFSPVDAPISDNTEFQISLNNLKWFLLTGNIQGNEPSTRQWFGFTSVSNKLIVFGGVGDGITLVLCSGSLAAKLWPAMAFTGRSA